MIYTNHILQNTFLLMHSRFSALMYTHVQQLSIKIVLQLIKADKTF